MPRGVNVPKKNLSKETLLKKGKSPKEVEEIIKTRTQKSAESRSRNARVSAYLIETVLEEIQKTEQSKYQGKISEIPVIKKYARKIIDEAILHPNSQASRILAQAVGFNDGFIDRCDRWLDQAQKQDEEFRIWRLRKLLTPDQQIVFDDPDELILIHHGRRWGKSFLCAAKLILQAGLNGKPCAVVHKNQKNGIEQYWQILKDIAKQTGVDVVKENRVEGIITFASGGTVSFFGNDSKFAADRIRGYHFALVICDEIAFHTGNQKYLVEDVLSHATGQHADRQIILSTTPPRGKLKYLDKIRETKKVYTGNMTANTKQPELLNYYTNLKAEKGMLTSFLREVEGEWLYDTDALIWQPKEWKFCEDEIIGVDRYMAGADFGFNDQNSYVFVAANSKTRQFWLIHEDQWHETGAIQSMERFKSNYIKSQEWLKERGLTGKLFVQIDHDQKMIASDMVSTYKISAEEAIKTDKLLNIQKVSDLMKQGKIFLDKDSIVYEECEAAVWKRDDNDELLNEIDDSAFHPEAMMAFQYAMNRLIFDLRI